MATHELRSTTSAGLTWPPLDKYKSGNPPGYPENALRNGEQGVVLLRVRVDATGNVVKVDVDSSKTTAESAELQASAAAAGGWKFIPGRKNGKPVGGWITIPATFSLGPTDSCPEGQAHVAKAPFQCAPAQSGAPATR
ncbi:MAG: energy transducer TonB [Xanthomonadaceae bacterium]|nr:energy transducer TonB [Xanthomonadaceae bacterium]